MLAITLIKPISKEMYSVEYEILNSDFNGRKFDDIEFDKKAKSCLHLIVKKMIRLALLKSCN